MAAQQEPPPPAQIRVPHTTAPASNYPGKAVPPLAPLRKQALHHRLRRHLLLLTMAGSSSSLCPWEACWTGRFRSARPIFWKLLAVVGVWWAAFAALGVLAVIIVAVAGLTFESMATMPVA